MLETRNDESEGRFPRQDLVPPIPRPSMPSLFLPALIAAFLAAHTPELSAQSKPNVGVDSRVHALGRLEPASGLITVGSRPGQRIDEVKVSVGDVVSAGQVLAVLEGRRQAEAQLALAELQKRQMEFQRNLRLRKLELERAEFEKTHEPRLAAATTVAGELRSLLNKVEGLWKLSEGAAALTGAAPDRQKLEDNGRYLELLAKTTQAELDLTLLKAEAELKKQQFELEADGLAWNESAKSDGGDAKPDNPEFLLPDAQVEQAKAALEQTEVVAPSAGTILDVVARPGEVGTGQLLILGDLTQMAAVAEVFQSQIGQVSVGDAATVTILDKSTTGKVTRVGSLVGRNQATNLDPRALKDVRVVKVWITLDDPATAATLVNMEADVAITPAGGR